MPDAHFVAKTEGYVCVYIRQAKLEKPPTQRLHSASSRKRRRRFEERGLENSENVLAGSLVSEN